MTDYGLTQEECEVLRHAARGMSLTESAEVLGVSRKTMHGYSTSAIKKLGAQNLTHAVAIAMREGVIEL